MFRDTAEHDQRFGRMPLLFIFERKYTGKSFLTKVRFFAHFLTLAERSSPSPRLL